MVFNWWQQVLFIFTVVAPYLFGNHFALATEEGKATSCCDALAAKVGSKQVLRPLTPAYILSITKFWSNQARSVKPACFFHPSNTKDVSHGVALLASRGCKFSIRGGGHTPFAAAANIEDGVAFDLSAFDFVKIAKDKKSVRYGPANKWINVYLPLERHGLSTSGGRVANVGVSGLMLGGGISFFAPRYGFDCDDTLNFEVVLGNGSIVNANRKRHPDLFRALRGASNNFGVVTSITARAFPQGKFWGGTHMYSIKTRKQHFKAFERFTDHRDYDPYASLINSYTFVGATQSWLIVNDIEYTKSDPPNTHPAYFRNFTSIPRISTTARVAHLSSFALELAAVNLSGRRDFYMTATYGNSAELMETFFDIANDTVMARLTDIPSLIFSISFQPLPRIITRKAARPVAAPGNSLGIDPEEVGDVFNALLTIMWQDPADDARIEAACRHIFARADAEAKKMGLLRRYLYLNYAAKWQRPIHSYGQESVNRLKAVSARYDPHGVFQRLVPGGFKLADG